MTSEYLEQQLVQSAWASRSTSDALDALLELPSDAIQGRVERDLWDAMRHLVSSGNMLNEVGIMHRLQAQGKLGPDGAYWVTYRNKLNGVDSEGPQPISKLREAVLDAYVRREGIAILSDATNSISDTSKSATDVLMSYAERMTSLSARQVGAEEDTFGKFMAEMAEHGKPISTIPKQGIFSCTPSLHSDCPFPIGGIHITAAAPNTGKTTKIISDIILSISMGLHVTFASLDMPGPVVTNMLVAAHSGIEVERIVGGRLEGDELSRVITSAAVVREHVDLIAMPSMTDWDTLSAAIIRSIIKNKSVVVAIDHFGEVGTLARYGNTEADRKAYVIRSMKNLVQKYMVAMALAVQINREGSEGEPYLKHLAETAHLERCAMSVCILWQEEAKSNDRSNLFGGAKSAPSYGDNEVVYLRLAKNQIGPKGRKIVLKRHGGISTFTEVERETEWKGSW